jgi:hypothetical protein
MEATSLIAEPRKANLGDAMILIVALAVGLAIASRPLSARASGTP